MELWWRMKKFIVHEGFRTCDLLICSLTRYHWATYLSSLNMGIGWNGTSRGPMPASARDNLLPRQCLVYYGVAGVSCNLTLSFRLVYNPTCTRIHREWATGLSASPYRVDFTILISHAPSRELVIYSEVIMSCFNHSLTDSLNPNTQQFGQELPLTARFRRYS